MAALAVSGVNYGENIGEGIAVSGTVGAAMEAASLGVSALAISLQTAPEHYYTHSLEVDFAVAAHFVRLFATATLLHGLPADVDLLKIDIPQAATIHTPWRWTRLSRRRYFHPVPPRRNALSDPAPMGFRTGFDIERLEKDSDVWAVLVDHIVSVTPIVTDMTAHGNANDLENWFVSDKNDEY